MDDSHQASADKARSLIERGSHDRGMFRAALLSVPPAIRDGWLDLAIYRSTLFQETFGRRTASD